jgi:MFS family permease
VSTGRRPRGDSTLEIDPSMNVSGDLSAVGCRSVRIVGVTHTAWGATIVLSMTLLAGAVMRSVFSPLQEAAMLELQLTDFQISLVQGLGTGIPGALIGLLIARIIDHGNRVRLLITLILVCALGTIGTSFVHNFTGLLVGRMCTAVAADCTAGVVISLAADYCVRRQRGRAILMMGFGLLTGIALGFWLGGALLDPLASSPASTRIAWLAGVSPWRKVHLVIGLAGALGLVPLLLLREPERNEVQQSASAVRPLLRSLWGKRTFLMPFFLAQLGVTLADSAATIWAAPVLIRNYHLPPQQFAGWMGGLLFIGGLTGSIFGGLSADWGQRSVRRGAVLAGAVVAAGLGVPAALFPIMPTVGGFAVMMGVMTLSGTATAMVASTTVAVLIPNEERGTCMALYGVVRSVLGLSIAPSLVTFGSWAMGGEQHLAPALATVGVLTGALSFVAYLLAMRNAPVPAGAPG